MGRWKDGWVGMGGRGCSSVRKKDQQYQQGMLVLHYDGVLVVDKMVYISGTCEGGTVMRVT